MGFRLGVNKMLLHTLNGVKNASEGTQKLGGKNIVFLKSVVLDKAAADTSFTLAIYYKAGRSKWSDT